MKLPEEYEKEIRSCTQSIEEQTAVYKACADKLRGGKDVNVGVVKSFVLSPS